MALGLIGYVPYIRNIARGTNKPHAFSWLVWAIASGVTFAAQVVDKGGPGAWVNGLAAMVCLGIALYAFVKGERGFAMFDWVSLSGALLAILLWLITSMPLVGVVLATLSDLFGFLPTIRKTYYRPHEETVSIYVLSAFKYAVSLAALQTYSMTTLLNPAYLVVVNGLFVILVLVRRRKKDIAL